MLCNGLVGTLCALVHVASLSPGHVAQCLAFSASSPADLALLGFVGFYACCCGDTWASEVGAVLGGRPRLITTLRHVPPGTNGAVSLVGLAASALGGAFVGLAFVLAHALLDGVLPLGPLAVWPLARAAPKGAAVALGEACPRLQLWIVPIGAAAGLLGSLIDSLLGAVLQETRYDEERKVIVGEHDRAKGKAIAGIPILSNNAVNFVSSALTAVLTAAVATWLL